MSDAVAFEHHLTSPQGRGGWPAAGFTVEVDGGACGDRLRFSIALDDAGHVADAGFDADGCGTTTAAASAAVSLVRGLPVLEAARIGAREIAGELGGLSPGKHHAADLAADALARALGAAVRARAPVRARPTGASVGVGGTLVAMSGGVDSAVAAVLCARSGGPVAAVTLELWSDRHNDGERSCCSASAVAQARALAHSLELPHFTVDLRAEFRAGVVDPFIAAFAAGETPNPCVGCNGHVRLDAMLELADSLGCDALATGHYARVLVDGAGAGPLLRVAADLAKDQTYMLAALAPRSLARMQFPLGELTKAQVRALAAEIGLPVADKPDSQDLCFLAGTDRASFLARHGGPGERPGVIADRAGAAVGRHRGQHLYTVGQRRGLRVASAEPLYVLRKHAASNTVVVGPREALRTREVPIRGVTLHRDAASVDRVKLRYRSRPVPASLVEDTPAGRHHALTLALAEPVDGAAPGQLACLMDGEMIVGSGTISPPPNQSPAVREA